MATCGFSSPVNLRQIKVAAIQGLCNLILLPVQKTRENPGVCLMHKSKKECASETSRSRM